MLVGLTTIFLDVWLDSDIQLKNLVPKSTGLQHILFGMSAFENCNDQLKRRQVIKKLL
jgi:hypothetical protein